MENIYKILNGEKPVKDKKRKEHIRKLCQLGYNNRKWHERHGGKNDY